MRCLLLFSCFKHLGFWLMGTINLILVVALNVVCSQGADGFGPGRGFGRGMGGRMGGRGFGNFLSVWS